MRTWTTAWAGCGKGTWECGTPSEEEGAPAAWSPALSDGEVGSTERAAWWHPPKPNQSLWVHRSDVQIEAQGVPSGPATRGLLGARQLQPCRQEPCGACEPFFEC